MDFKNILIALGILLVISALMGLLLALASKYLAVKEDNRIKEVTAMLPGFNCGACGHPGCSGFAASLVNGETKKVSGCKVIKADKKQPIVDYLKATPGPDGSTVEVDI